MLEIEIVQKPLKEVCWDVEVSSCLLLHEERFLMLQRAENAIEGGTWCLPAGKMEVGESEIQAARRELLEETSIESKDEDLQFLHTFYVRRKEINFLFHVFVYPLSEKPTVIPKEDEISGYAWVTEEESLSLPLITGGKEVLLKSLAKI